MSKDKKPQQPKTTEKQVPLRKSWVPESGGRASDNIDDRKVEVTRRPTPPPPEDKDD